VRADYNKKEQLNRGAVYIALLSYSVVELKKVMIPSCAIDCPLTALVYMYSLYVYSALTCAPATLSEADIVFEGVRLSVCLRKSE